jgi:transcriptional regulator with XRE-family HTH domain
MTPREIRAQMVLKGITLTGLAAKLKVDHSFVWQVVNGRRNNVRVRGAIADAIGLPVDKVFDSSPPQKRTANA